MESEEPSPFWQLVNHNIIQILSFLLVLILVIVNYNQLTFKIKLIAIILMLIYFTYQGLRVLAGYKERQRIERLRQKEKERNLTIDNF